MSRTTPATRSSVRRLRSLPTQMARRRRKVQAPLKSNEVDQAPNQNTDEGRNKYVKDVR